mmetsp:Transcript_35314/g.62983  ORF Transcript_35314/g.62983 Transcript_35314/m.62983 type:complete len:110 (-) Transcript_35314:12-341(-)
MISYCPTCANMLLVEQLQPEAELRYFCQTCPYMYSVDRELSKRVSTVKKEVDDVLGGEAAWANVAKTDARCRECEFHQAYFMEIQIRSADEPATLFFKCVKCGFQWREG